MTNTALFSPADYVSRLHTLPVPGYDGHPDGTVAITHYMSANPQFGGNAGPATLRQAIARAAAQRADILSRTRSAGYARVFTGQGAPGDFINVMEIVVALRD